MRNFERFEVAHFILSVPSLSSLVIHNYVKISALLFCITEEKSYFCKNFILRTIEYGKTSSLEQ